MDDSAGFYWAISITFFDIGKKNRVVLIEILFKNG